VAVFDERSNDARARLAAVPPPDDFLPFDEADANQSIVQRFDSQVARHAGAQAIRTDQNSCTYEELNAASNRVGHAVRSVVGDPLEPAIVALSGGIPSVVATLGALKAGKMYVPIDPDAPIERLASIVANSRARVIITSRC
jgi:non-ribosomal peptide synthetase component F